MGRLPWNVNRFLEDAHRNRDLLRQIGPVYQFRHDRLENYLAGPPRTGLRLSPEARELATLSALSRRDRSRRVRARVVTSVAVLAIPVIFGGLTIPALRERLQEDRADRRSGQAAALALRADELEAADPDNALRLRIAAAEADSDDSALRELATFLEWRGSPAVTLTHLENVSLVGHWMIGRRPDGVVLLWDLLSAEPRAAVLTTGVDSLLDGVGNVVVLRSGDESRVWRFDDRIEQMEIRLRADEVDDVGDRWIAQRGKDGAGYLTDLTRPGAPAFPLGAAVDRIRFDYDERWAVVTEESGRTRLWDLRGRLDGPVATLPRAEYDPAGLVYSPDFWGITNHGEWIILRNWSGLELAFRPRDSAARLFNASDVGDFVLGPPGRLAYSDGTSLNVLDLDRPNGTIPLVTDVAGTEFDRDGRRVLTVREDGRADLVDLTTWPPVVTSLGENADQSGSWITARWALVAHKNGTSRLWNLTGRIREAGPGYLPHGYAVFSEDLSWTVVRGPGNRPALWRVGGGAPVDLGAGPEAEDADFDIDGNVLMALNENGESLLWRLSGSGAASGPVPLGRAVENVNVSADGRWAVVEHGNADDNSWHTDDDVRRQLVSIRRLDVSPPHRTVDAWGEACALAGRPLSRSRWINLVPGIPYRTICQARPAPE